MTMLMERMTAHRATKEEATALRSALGVGDSFFDPEFRHMNAAQIARSILTEIEEGASHWYVDAGMSKDDCVALLQGALRKGE